MCYNISIITKADKVESWFDARFEERELYHPIYHANAFSDPCWPVITNEKPGIIQFYRWGLIPFWTKSNDAANSIRLKTCNARAETVDTKPSFRVAVRKNRCLVLVDGFFEWHHENKKKYPYYIRLKNQNPFAMAGIWDFWKDKGKGTIDHSFSIITTRANPLMEYVHNTKKRMPVILKREDKKRWLNMNLEMKDVMAMLNPYDEKEMEAYTVSRLITSRGIYTNTSAVLEPLEYEDIEASMPA